MAFTSDTEDKELLSRVEDLADLYFTRNKPVFLGFLNEREQYVIKNAFPFYSSIMKFYGGFDGAKRRFLCFFEDEVEFSLYPISKIFFKFRITDKLSHRDFLGALMNLGIERSCVGDIIVNEGAAVCFVKEEIRNYIESQISKIGKTGVKIVDVSECVIDYSDDIESDTYIVSSLRLDAVVAAVTKLSRAKACSLVLSGKTFVNHYECKNVSLSPYLK